MPRHERPRPNLTTGWTDWIAPIHKRYQMSCCDCGLVHTLRFRVLRVTRYTGRGRFNGQIAHGVRVQFQARRDERATAATRRARKPSHPRTASRGKNR